MTMPWRALAGLLLLGLVASTILGCGGDGPPASGAGEETPAAPGRGPSLEEPPGTTVTAAGRSVEAGIGSYCWTSMCVDKIGPITRGRLEVDRGTVVSVALPRGVTALRSANVTAFPAGASQDVGNGNTAWQPDFERGTELPATISGPAVEFAAQLPAGPYVVSIGMFVASGGDVQYGVLLEVR